MCQSRANLEAIHTVLFSYENRAKLIRFGLGFTFSAVKTELFENANTTHKFEKVAAHSLVERLLITMAFKLAVVAS